MKLWQRTFLTTLALVIVLVNVTSLTILKSNHDNSLAREQQSALARHSSLRNEISYVVVNTKLSERTVVLSAERMDALFADVLGPLGGDGLSGACLYLDGVRVYASETWALTAEDVLLDAPEYSSTITRSGSRVYLLVASSPQFNNATYRLITYYDVTATYELLDDTFNQARLLGIVSALFVAGVLLLLVRMLLRPLLSLTDTSRQIAAGDLEKRVAVHGNDEVAELAKSFNSMADSIESSVTELEQLAESRRIFIGNLAHEMRTPLTSILGYADLLRVQRQVSDQSRVEFANIIVNETKRLQSLSGKLMELLNVGNLNLNFEPIDLYELASELALSLQPLFNSRQMTLLCRIPTYNCVVLADRELLQSLILNLVDNAMKASTEGATITIAAREILREDKDSPTQAPERRIVVGVIDDGIGIPAEEIPQLTEPFYMLDKARTRRHGGAGLGLALCAEIAKAHGSELFIESELGVGTTVSCDFAAAFGPVADINGDQPRLVVAGGEGACYTAFDDVKWHPGRSEAEAKEVEEEGQPEAAADAEDPPEAEGQQAAAAPKAEAPEVDGQPEAEGQPEAAAPETEAQP